MVSYHEFYRWYWRNYPVAFIRDLAVTLTLLPRFWNWK